MNEIDQHQDIVYRRLRQNPVSQIEDVTRSLIDLLHQLAYAP